MDFAGVHEAPTWPPGNVAAGNMAARECGCRKDGGPTWRSNMEDRPRWRHKGQAEVDVLSFAIAACAGLAAWRKKLLDEKRKGVSCRAGVALWSICAPSSVPFVDALHRARARMIMILMIDIMITKDMGLISALRVTHRMLDILCAAVGDVYPSIRSTVRGDPSMFSGTIESNPAACIHVRDHESESKRSPRKSLESHA